MKTNGEELPNVLEIWIEEVCYSLFLWWEIRPSLRKASFDNRGKACCSRGKVGGDAIARIGPRVVEEEEDARLKVLQQSVEGTGRQVSGPGRKEDPSRSQVGSGARPLNGLNLVSGLSISGLAVVPKDFKLAGGLSLLGPLADLKSKGPAMVEVGPLSSKDEWWASEEENTLSLGLDVLEGDSSLGPSQIHLEDRAQSDKAHPSAWFGLRNWSNSESEFLKLWETEVMRKQQVEDQQTTTDLALVEEAMRYGNVLVSWGKRDFESSPSLSFSFGLTPMGEYYDHSGALREVVQGESPLRLITVDGITKDATTTC